MAQVCCTDAAGGADACAGGQPTVCSLACAEAWLPLFRDCGPLLAAIFDGGDVQVMLSLDKQTTLCNRSVPAPSRGLPTSAVTAALAPIRIVRIIGPQSLSDANAP
jgi:hypothetical protein